MQSLSSICKKLGRSSRLFVELTPSISFSTSCYFCSQKKKNNSYQEVDQNRYSNLTHSIVSTRVCSQTPESLLQEDELLYGPVSKCKTQEQGSGPKVAQNTILLLNPEKRNGSNTLTNSIPLKIPLQKNKMPSVTRILQQTMTERQILILERWKQRMILELGEDGFEKYTSDIFLQGKHFHEVLEAMLSSPEQLKELNEKTINSGYVTSVQHVLKDISGVRALESAVHHETLKYLGLMDCVAEYRGKLCVIDWKTSEKPKPFIRNTFDNPLQVVAYVGAINHDANYNFEVQCGLIVVAYKNGSPAHTHFMDSDLCSQYWSKWLLRLEKYTEKEKNQTTENPK
ncbi:mitochondrial genome maintenance exonuclease 1 isoform X1 [Monodelphis domestica]|uniref:mitochondrial genome maintenance exonuclease 1 isoform X1 n=1 Tax=Monodelphis domestica TaxID=13616 RepID=UPI0024E1B094|nr:mitochondrial genome maintenance exonuclease 1 isoform X1 [Monodelphis domestica]XP_056669832.1 mitochondrial genome maintenance exonuclease 1 isoform X1 [Monodelphis domestica]